MHRNWRLAAAIALACLPLASVATAQVPATPATGITIRAGTPTGLVMDDGRSYVPYMGNVTVPVRVTVGCVTLLANAASPEVHVEVVDAPSWLVWSDTHVPFDPMGCGAAGNATQDAGFTLGVKSLAPGVVLQNITLEAAMGDASNRTVVPIHVQFHPDYDISPGVQFPLTVRNGTATFPVTVTNRANARGMVMIEGVHATTGTLSGIGPAVYERPDLASPTVMHFNVTFKAPAQWTQANATFTAYAHFLVPGYGAGQFQDATHVAWTFVNGSPNGTPSPGTPGAKSPMPVAALLGIALLGAAMVARAIRRTR